MHRVSRIRAAPSGRSRGLAEVELLAWLLDNSVPVPGTGRRFGIDAVIGLVPVVGDAASAGLGLFIIWRASRLGLPRVAVARMLANTLIDLAIGMIPIIGDAFDLWFKANTRNLGIMRRHLAAPAASTRGDWLGLGAVLAVLLVALVAVAWLVVAAISALAGALS